jgi:hypothetical protein
VGNFYSKQQQNGRLGFERAKFCEKETAVGLREIDIAVNIQASRTPN